MTETQKEKIARLEEELANAKSIAERTYQELISLRGKADKEFEASSTFQQLKSENERLRQYNKILESRLKKVAEKSDAQIQLIEELQGKNVKPVHNARGAGRKPKFTSKQVEEIKAMRASGESIKSIAKEKNCSVGLVHKLISE